MKRIVPILLFLVLALLAGAGFTPVGAHAMLMRSIPDANASLSISPARVELFFSETVAGVLSKIKVLDASGKSVDSGDSSLDSMDATHLQVSLPSLADGVYLVVWRMVSATDGHQTSGSFPFAIGKVAPSALAAVNSQAAASVNSYPVADMLAKGFLYLAVTALLGGILFTFLAWNPSLRKANLPVQDLQSYARFSRILMLAAILTLVVADILSLMVQAGQAAGTLVRMPWQPEFIAILTGTRVGTLGIVRLGAGLLLAVLLLPRPDRWNRWLALALCLLLVLTFSLESHAAGYSHPALPVLADWFHMTAVSVWVGGLFSFLGGMFLIRKLSSQPRTLLTSILIPHFTTLAMTSVGILVVTGIYSSTLDVAFLSALWNTTYGRALIVKLLIASPMLALGGINFLFTTPIMRRAAARPDGSSLAVSRFQYLLTGESVLGVIMLLWVGAFTTLPPASMTFSTAGITKTAQADDLTVTLKLDPGQPGLNTFTTTLKSGGKPVADAQDVSLEFTSLSGMVPPDKAAMTALGNGKYSLQGGYLGLPDNWDIKVVVIRPGKFDAYANFNFVIGKASVQPMP